MSSGRRATASAPGKLILHGEHSVVYGKLAVSTCLSELRVMVSAEATSDGMVQVVIPDVDNIVGADTSPFAKAWTTEELREELGSLLSFPGGVSPAQIPEAGFAAVLERLCRGCGPMNSKAIVPTLYLIVTMFAGALGLVTDDDDDDDDEDGDETTAAAAGAGSGSGSSSTSPRVKGLSVEIALPTLPVAAGLGSSAAFSVATSAALVHLYQQVAADSPSDSGVVDTSADPIKFIGEDVQKQYPDGRSPTSEFRTLINNWAFCAETLFHGQPSGMDNSTSCFGGALSYVKEPKCIDQIPHMPALRILVTNTNVPKDTRALVAGVRARRDTFPAVMNPLLDSMDAVAKAFIDATEAAKDGSDASMATLYDTVGTLVDVNQSLLDAIGVGHTALTALCTTSKKLGLHSKLTGGGGGGCGFTLLPPDVTPETVQTLKDSLAELGFTSFETVAGGPGVCLHPPMAVWDTTSSATTSEDDDEEEEEDDERKV